MLHQPIAQDAVRTAYEKPQVTAIRRQLGREIAIRALDISIATTALIFLSPLLGLTAAVVKGQDGGPVFFGHKRLGKDGRTFRCWKFRSMVTDAEARLQALLARDPVAKAEWDADHKLRDDPRITKLGLFLRKSSLDELPQLFNVLTGEMSIVGPRPIVAAEAHHYGRWFPRYLAQKPGITGLWQVGGRNDVGYRTRVAYDVLYGRRRGVAVNLGVMFATLPAVLLRKGSY